MQQIVAMQQTAAMPQTVRKRKERIASVMKRVDFSRLRTMGISYFIWRVDAFRRQMYYILCIDVVDDNDSNDLGEEREEDRAKEDREEDRDEYCIIAASGA